jgi:hypothetical protein
MTMVTFWVLMVYDSLFGLPHVWLKAGVGLATGFFIRSRIIGLLTCLAGDGLIFIYPRWFYTASAAPSDATPIDVITLLVMGVLVFSGVLWWFVGRFVRWIFDKIRARLMPIKPAV